MKRKKLKKILLIAVPIAVVLLVISIPFDMSKESDQGGQPTISPFDDSGSVEFSPFSDSEDDDSSATSSSLPLTLEEVSALDKLLPHLPVYIGDFQTSVGLVTTINMFQLFSDPWDVVRLDIYGVDYQRRAINYDDPNMIAFKESFLKLKEVLAERGVDISELNLYFGEREYVRKVAEFWVENLDIL